MTQVQQKVNYDVKRLLPSLHGLASLVSENMSTVTATKDLTELAGVLFSIQTSLETILEDSSRSTNNYPHVPTTSSDNDQVNNVSGKRTISQRPRLMAPSPERRQKRKDSHAPF